MTTLKSLLLGTAFATAAATAALAADPEVAEIDVVVQFSNVDSNALQFYPDLETDLESRLADTLAPFRDDDGGRLMVFITGVTVDGSEILTTSGAFNGLNGGVQYYPRNPDQSGDASAVTPKTTDIRVVAVPDMPATVDPLGPAYLILPSDATVYDVMINRFAEVVAERLPDM